MTSQTLTLTTTEDREIILYRLKKYFSSVPYFEDQKLSLSNHPLLLPLLNLIEWENFENQPEGDLEKFYERASSQPYKFIEGIKFLKIGGYSYIRIKITGIETTRILGGLRQL